MFFLFGVGILSYKAVIHFFHIPEGQPKASSEPAIDQKDLTTATVEDVSKNLIFCVDEKNGDITKLILEVFSCAEHKLYYITIPVRTQYTMSETLYRELVLVDPAIPQVIRLSGITNYFPEDKVYDYGVLLMEDLLKLKVSYYTVMTDSVYHSVFITEEQKEDDSGAPKEIFTAKYSKFLKTLQSEKQVKGYLEEFYDTISSNLSVMDKLKYVESYLSLTPEDIRFEIIAGNQTNSAYIIDTAKAAEQLVTMTGNSQPD
jgi:hypothetical protein